MLQIQMHRLFSQFMPKWMICIRRYCRLAKHVLDIWTDGRCLEIQCFIDEPLLGTSESHSAHSASRYFHLSGSFLKRDLSYFINPNLLPIPHQSNLPLTAQQSTSKGMCSNLLQIRHATILQFTIKRTIVGGIRSQARKGTQQQQQQQQKWWSWYTPASLYRMDCESF